MHLSLVPFFNFFSARDENCKSDFQESFSLQIVPAVEVGLACFWFEIEDNKITMTPIYSNPEDINWDEVPEHEPVYDITNKAPEQVYGIIKQVRG
jgi:hypothetical protein